MSVCQPRVLSDVNTEPDGSWLRTNAQRKLTASSCCGTIHELGWCVHDVVAADFQLAPGVELAADVGGAEA